MARKKNKSREQDQMNMERRLAILREGAAVFLVGVTAYLAISLFSYSVQDPSFNNTGNGEISNLGGLVGAYLADFLLQLFGYSSVWLPIFSGLSAFSLMRRGPLGLHWEQIATLPMLAVVTTILSVMFYGAEGSPMPAGPGGLSGMMVTKALNQTLGHWGSLLLLMTLGLLCFMVLTRFSLFGTLLWLKDGGMSLYALIVARSHAAEAARQQDSDNRGFAVRDAPESYLPDVRATEIPAFRFRDMKVAEVPASGFRDTKVEEEYVLHPEVAEVLQAAATHHRPAQDRSQETLADVSSPAREQRVETPEAEFSTPRLGPGKFLAPVAGLVIDSVDRVTSILKRPEKKMEQPEWLSPMEYDPSPALPHERQEPALDDEDASVLPSRDESESIRSFHRETDPGFIEDALPLSANMVDPSPPETPVPFQDAEVVLEPEKPEPSVFRDPVVTREEGAQQPGSWIAAALALKREAEVEVDTVNPLRVPSESDSHDLDPVTLPQPDLTPFSSSRRDLSTEPVFDTEGEMDDLDEGEDDFALPKNPLDMPREEIEVVFEEDEGDDEVPLPPNVASHQPEERLEKPVKMVPLPPMDLLEKSTGGAGEIDREYLTQQARLLELKLADFKIKGQITNVLPGPVVTTFEFDPAPGLRASKVISISDDLARSILSPSVRVVGNIPGKNVIGVEVPNQTRNTVYLREILESEQFIRTGHPLAVALGSDITGNPVVANLAKMPHLLVAGTTGSGKSVALNAMICSILFSARPDQVRFLMVDPKMLELSIYEGIPHLLAPVVTDVHKAANLLKWAVLEMEERYRLMSEVGVRSLESFNRKIQHCLETGERPMRRVKVGFDPETGSPVEQEEPISLVAKPLIVIVIDELADLMIQVGKEVEPAIARLAQMARAAGLHLIIATQRPSVDVITGLIKANFPTRLAFQVSSKIDSRTILDAMGAERLLGMGDGLYLPPGTSHLKRIHAPLVTDNEVHKLVGFLKETCGSPKYDMAVMRHASDDDGDGDLAFGDSQSDAEPVDAYDPLYDQAVALVVRARKVSTSMVQRHFKIGYNRAARIVERMELDGLVTPSNTAGKREVLTPGQQEDSR